MDDESPRPVFQGYYRPAELPFGTPTRLRALVEGYRMLNRAALVWVAFLLAGIMGLLFESPTSFLGLVFLTISVPVTLWATWSPALRSAAGLGKRPAWGVVAAVCAGLGAPFCWGGVVLLIVQDQVHREIKKYGLRSTWMGFRQADVERSVAELEAKWQALGIDPDLVKPS